MLATNTITSFDVDLTSRFHLKRASLLRVSCNSNLNFSLLKLWRRALGIEKALGTLCCPFQANDEAVTLSDCEE